jgi:hypothetical protein
MNISRDKLLYEQEDIDTLIDKANKEIANTELEQVYDDDKLNRMVIEWDILRTDEMKVKIARYMLILLYKLGGKRIMNEMVAKALEALMETDLDDKFYKILADKVKEEIPGTQYEPIMGELLIQLGNELKKPEDLK